MGNLQNESKEILEEGKWEKNSNLFAEWAEWWQEQQQKLQLLQKISQVSENWANNLQMQ